MAQKKRKVAKAMTARAVPPSREKLVSSDALPRRTLEEALPIAQVIRDVYANKAATWSEIAKAKGVSDKNPVNRYPLWAATAYGIILRAEDHTYSLAETGRKIFAPTFEGEREEGVKKALFTPSVLSRFYTDYNGSTLPNEEMLGNVLETRYGVPRERTVEAIKIIRDNARYANALVQRGDGKDAIEFSDVAFPIVKPADAAAAETTAEESENPNPSAHVGGTTEDWSKVCFVITPIGSDDSQERKHSDTILKHLLEPVLSELGLRAVRADKIAKPGIITKQVIEYIAFSKLCISDLSFNNPNAFYELGARHAFKLSTIQIIRKGDKIPFDVSQGRTIVIDTSDPYTIMDRFEAARKELKEHVTAISTGTENQEDNPISLFLPGLKVVIPKIG